MFLCYFYLNSNLFANILISINLAMEGTVISLDTPVPCIKSSMSEKFQF